MKIVIRDLQKKIRISPERIKKIIIKVLSLEGIRKSGQLTVSLVGDRQIKRLNRIYFGKDNPTDVISFDISKDKKELLADIVISTDTAIGNSRIFKTTPLYEACLYTVHGLLHLLGYGDKNTRQRKIMDNRSKRILKLSGIK